MALHVVPYNNAMRLGQGFNTYTQEICVDNAVVGITSREDSQRINPAPHIPIAGPPDDKGTGGSTPSTDPDTGAETGVTTVPKDVDILDTLATETTLYPSQIVTYTSKYVNKLSDVANSLNVSGSLSIKYGELSGGGAGSYVDSDTFQAADVNFLVMVKVLNQTVNVKDQLDFYPLKQHQNDTPMSPYDFISVYGDSFISGFQEGGCFHAIVSMRSFDQNKITDIKANANIALQIGVGDISAQADVSMAKKQLEKDSEINITVNWAGGGQLKPDTERWTIDSLMDVASKFADLVALTPQRTHAILTKYTSLRRYLEWAAPKAIKLYDYEIAQLYTDELLDVYLGYKAAWKDIHNLIEDLGEGKVVLHESTAAPLTLSDETWKDLKVAPFGVFEPTFDGLDYALRICRLLMVRIIREVDAIKKDPTTAIESTRGPPYIRPQIIKGLLPTAEVATAAPRPADTANLTTGTWELAHDSVQQSYLVSEERTDMYNLVFGFNRLDVALGQSDFCNVNQYIEYLKLQFDVDPATKSAGDGQPPTPVNPQVYGVKIPWLLFPKSNRDLSAGVFTARDDRKRGRASLESPDVAYFNSVLEDEPVVLLWLNSWCFFPKRPATVWDASVSLTTLQSTRAKFYPAVADLGRVQDPQARESDAAKSRPARVTGSWLAFPRNLTGVDGGVIAFRNPKLVKTNMGDQGRQRFGRGKFKTTPQVFFGLKGFRYIDDSGEIVVPRIMVEISNLDTDGFNWNIATWAGVGTLGMAEVTWFAFESHV